VVANRTLARAQQLAYDLAHPPANDACATEGDACAPAETGAGDNLACPALLAEKLQEAGLEIGEGDVSPDVSPDVPPATPAADAVALEDLPNVLPRVDLVITSAGSPETVLTYEALAPLLRRRDRPLFIVDIAVPRNVDERLGGLDNVFLYNIDDLDRLVARNVDRRQQEIPKAEAIVEDELGAYTTWLSSLQVAPTIKLLREFADAIQKAHLLRYGKKFTQADREQLEQFTQTLCNQMLHKPTALLKAIGENGATSEGLATVDIVRRLFGLDKDSSKL
jgi:glutamyl-tRNA reductase